MKNWRTSLGGAIGVFGTTLIGAGVLFHVVEEDVAYKKVIFMTVFIGVLLSAAGKAICAFSAADAKELAKLQQEHNTDHFKK